MRCLPVLLDVRIGAPRVTSSRPLAPDALSGIRADTMGSKIGPAAKRPGRSQPGSMVTAGATATRRVWFAGMQP